MARALRIPGSETRAQVTGLWPGTSYHFRISAENALGKSEPGSLLHAITELEGRVQITTMGGSERMREREREDERERMRESERKEIKETNPILHQDSSGGWNEL